MFIGVQVVGFAMLVLGAQGGIRLLVDHADGGLVGWVPGGFAAWLVVDVLLVVVGVVLASWGQARVRGLGLLTSRGETTRSRATDGVP